VRRRTLRFELRRDVLSPISFLSKGRPSNVNRGLMLFLYSYGVPFNAIDFFASFVFESIRVVVFSRCPIPLRLGPKGVFRMNARSPGASYSGAALDLVVEISSETSFDRNLRPCPRGLPPCRLMPPRSIFNGNGLFAPASGDGGRVPIGSILRFARSAQGRKSHLMTGSGGGLVSGGT